MMNSLDNSGTSLEPTALDINGAASVFAEMLDPKEAPANDDGSSDSEGVKEPELEVETEAAPEGEADANNEETVTIEVDGKPVELTKAQLAEAYKSGLRQADYTKKTMEASEQRKAADAEIQKAQQERAIYAQKLQQQEAVLSAALQEQQKIDWEQLLNNDPVEFMRQKHLSEQRQAALQQTMQEQHFLRQQFQAEQAISMQRFLSEQQEQLLAKLPEWKDEGKAKAEKQALREFLSESGYSEDEIGNAADHRMIIIARDAMRFREMMNKAKAASKKVENVPQRVERPAAGSAPSIDKRSAQFQKLSKSGRVEDAAAIFASLL